jgi:hypothetical protein
MMPSGAGGPTSGSLSGSKRWPFLRARYAIVATLTQPTAIESQKLTRR